MASQELGDFSGQILCDRYQVQQQLGKKAGRRTLLARDLQTQELVVVKLLLFGNDFEWNDLKLFEREAETLKALSHPAIPRYLDYFELDSPNGKGFALVQSYIEAKSLDEQLKAGRSFSEVEVKQLAKAILEILIYLHGRQPPVIHRDIKPSNILLTNRSGNSVGQVYLVDFGSVQTLAARQSSTMTVVGTYGYMPPEQLGGRATPGSDLYSLGATLIYLVTGQHPADLPQTDLRIEFEQAANISSGFTNWLKWITEPILSKRLASAQDALQALEQPRNATRRRVTQVSVRKPPGSKVELTKNAASLEIIIPAVGFLKSITLSYLFCLSLPLVIVSCLSSIGGSGQHIVVKVFLVTLLVWFFYVLMCVFGRKIIYINQQQIFLSYNLFGIDIYAPKPSHRQDIIRIDRNKDAYNNPYLIIWAGIRNYEIFSGEFQIFSVSAPELDWIAQELSNWLGLPITKD